MKAIWGGKKKDDNDENEDNDNDQNTESYGTQESTQHPATMSGSVRSGPPPRRRDPTERTRLLQDNNPPPRADGYLDPDDPAVSPYNIWSVRALRNLTVLFALITFVWWILLLVTIFVSIPGLYTRGSGFTDFSYTTLTMGNLLVALIFFTGPSASVRIAQAVVAALLLINTIIIVSVNKTRHEEAWAGVASVIWASLIAAWCVVTDRVVAWGKKEEETRLTGRPETRRTLGQWIAVLVETFIVVVFIVIIVFMTGTLVLRAIDAGVPYDGELYSVSGDQYNVHLQCIGNITKDPITGKQDPTIILEAGDEPCEYDFEHWLYSSYQNGTISRYCYWDRPGYAWSDSAPSPHSAGKSAYALREALALAGVEGPYVAVSAGYGSIVSRVWISQNVADVAGIMLVDPLHEDLLYKIGAPLRGFELWGWGILSPLGIRRLAGAIFNGRTREDRVYGKSVWQTGKFIKAKLQESLAAEGMTKNEVVTANKIIEISEDLPLVVVSSGITSRKDEEWGRKQRELSHLTKNLLSFDTVNKAPHQVWRTLDGRTVMEKRLGELVKAAKKA